MKVPHSICQQIWKTQQWLQEWKRSVFIPIPKKGNAKECSNYCTIVLISHSSKVILKILQARLQQNMNHELPDVQGGLEKAEEPEIKLPTSVASSKKQESSRITSTSALLELWFWRRLLRVPWTARRSNQSILKEISPGISLEGMMLKLKLQYFGHLMRRVDSLQKNSDAGRDWGKEEKGMIEDEIAGWHHRLDGHEFE